MRIWFNRRDGINWFPLRKQRASQEAETKKMIRMVDIRTAFIAGAESVRDATTSRDGIPNDIWDRACHYAKRIVNVEIHPTGCPLCPSTYVRPCSRRR